MSKISLFGSNNTKLWMRTNPHFQLRLFIEGIRGDQKLGRIFRHVSATGHPYSAAYLVNGLKLFYDPAGHASITRSEQLKQMENDFSGHFNILAHPKKPEKSLFIYDHNSGPAVKSQQHELPSLHEQFLFFSILLLKSGTGNFSIRLAPAGEKAEAVDSTNWNKTSQLFLPSESAESQFLQQLKMFI